MLRIAKFTDYAITLMTRLARAPLRRVSAQQLARELSLPAPTVAILLKTLARAGLVNSTRGAGGGYALTDQPQNISVARIISAIEGPVALTECALGQGRCTLETKCTTRDNWRLISQTVRVALEAVSLDSMAGPLRADQFGSFNFHAPKTAVPDG